MFIKKRPVIRWVLASTVLCFVVFLISCGPLAIRIREKAISPTPTPAPTPWFTITCPMGYIPVAHNTALGTTADFCVAKYEMKNVSGQAASMAAGLPWISISQTNAKVVCDALNAANGVSNKYFLISNPEWMTIAHNVEQVAANWSSGVAGVGMIAKGHSDAVPNARQEASSDGDSYYGTGNSATNMPGSGWEQRRTFILKEDLQVIWDFSGDVWEWVDWNVTPANKAYISTDGAPVSAWKEFSALDSRIGPTDEMAPATWRPFFTSLTSAVNMGAYNAGTNASGGAAIRGGHWYMNAVGGLYDLALGNTASTVSATVGFRCVYRP